MTEKKILQYLITVHWTLFSATTVVDKIIPDVYPLWVGADFYTLFIKFFSSLGLTDPLFATVALAGISILETSGFVCFVFSLIHLYKRNDRIAEQWCYRGILFSVITFTLFSIGDQFFGDRFSLLEHTIFWIISIFSWLMYKYNLTARERVLNLPLTNDLKIGLLCGVLLTAVTAISLFRFSNTSFDSKRKPVDAEKVVEGVYKFDIPFLGDKITLENTIKAFEENHTDLRVNYIWTGADELNSKKKTHMLLYVFTEDKN
jgi:hypothetical protein